MLGARAVIRGPIDLKLLPTPYFIVGDFEVDARAPQPAPDPRPSWRLVAKRLRLEIAPAPLLHGEVDFVEARLEEPRLELTLGPDGALPMMASEPKPAQRLRFEKIRLTDGALRVDDPAERRSFELDGLSLEAEAASLDGPFKGQGAVALGDQRIPFRFSTGAREQGAMKLKFSASGGGAFPAVTLEGLLHLGAGSQNFAGAAQFAGLDPPWLASGQLSFDARRAALGALELRIGDERPLVATGEAEADFSGMLKASATLRSDDVDLDAPGNGAALVRLVRAPPLPFTLSYGAKSVLFAGAAFSDVFATLVFGKPQDQGAPSPWLRFEAHGPGQSRLALDGQWRLGTGYDGKVQASGEDLRWLPGWLKPISPAWSPHTIFFRTIDLSASVLVSRAGLELRDLAAKIDDARLSGRLSYRPASGAAPSRFDADLATPSIGLAVFRDFDFASTLRAAAGDGSLRLDARALTTSGADSIGNLSFSVRKTGDQIALDEFTIEGSGGAVIAASGLLSKDALHWDARVAAPRDDHLVEILTGLVPDRGTGAILSQAGTLAPIDLDVTATAARKDAAFAIETLSAKGTMGGARIEAAIADDPKQPGAFSFSAIGEAKDSLPLLRLVGLAGETPGPLGPAHLEASAHGEPGRMARAKIAASVGAAKFAFDGEVMTDLDALSATGAMRFSSPDAAPLLRATGLVFPGFSTVVPVAASGDLAWSKTGFALDNLKAQAFGVALKGALAGSNEGRRGLTGSIDAESLPASALFALVLGAPEPVKAGALWSSLAFAPAAFELPDARIALRLHDMPLPAILPAALSARDASMTFAAGPGFLQMQGLAFELGSGRVAGDVTLRRTGADVSLESKLDVAELSLDLPSLQGRLSGTIDLVGTGKSADALVAGLAGEGRALIADLVVPHADPKALGRVVTSFDQDEHSLGKSEIAAALSKELKRGDFRAGSQNFDLAAASGVLRLSPSAPETAGFAGVSFDLRRGALAQALSFIMQPPPKGWTGAPPQVFVQFKGPIGAPAVEIDAAALSNALSLRAIQRESARIEDYEFDIHERAFFYQRLLSERRRERERLNAEADSAAPEKPARPQ